MAVPGWPTLPSKRRTVLRPQHWKLVAPLLGAFWHFVVVVLHNKESIRWWQQWVEWWIMRADSRLKQWNLEIRNMLNVIFCSRFLLLLFFLGRGYTIAKQAFFYMTKCYHPISWTAAFYFCVAAAYNRILYQAYHGPPFYWHRQYKNSL